MEIKIKNIGYVCCKSEFYSALDSINDELIISPGINKLKGDIDSGIWAASYFLSMYKHRPKDFILFEEPKVAINNQLISFSELSKTTCYMDKIHPLFSSRASVRKLVERGLRKSKLDYFPDDIKRLFFIDDERFERPISGVGNERFKVMAAIGFSNKKEIYCFPWLSAMRFKYFGSNLSSVLERLESLNKTALFPTDAI